MYVAPEQKTFFKQAELNHWVRKFTILYDQRRFRITIQLTTKLGNDMGTFEGNFSRQKLRKYLKTILGCPSRLDPVYQWKSFLVNNLKVLPHYLPLREIVDIQVIVVS